MLMKHLSVFILVMISLLKLTFSSSMISSLISLEFSSAMSFFLLFILQSPTMSVTLLVSTMGIMISEGIIGVTLLMSGVTSSWSCSSVSISTFYSI